MSDLSAAAAALGLPEPLVQRSAEARAAEGGGSVEDILAQWAGGETAPVSAATEQPSAEPETEAPEEVVEEPASATPEVVIETPGEATAPSPAPSGPYRPPVLVGVKDNPMVVLAGVVGLFLIMVLVGLVGPSVPVETPGARTSAIDYTDAALQGRDIYVTSGCAGCHTQMVRPIVADVGLGPVSLNDTDQVLGTRRFGPDLSNVGARLTGSQLEAVIRGLGDHPIHELDVVDLENLLAYLSESAMPTSSEANSDGEGS